MVYEGNTIIGILSQGPKGCREDKYPAIYTRVSSYLPFIHYALNDRLHEKIRTHDYLPRT